MAFKIIPLNSSSSRWIEVDENNDKRIVRVNYNGKQLRRKILFCENITTSSGTMCKYFTFSFLGSLVMLEDKGDIEYDITRYVS